MLGKYDESYVYEKETDILSDSDPTDADQPCDSQDCNGTHINHNPLKRATNLFFSVLFFIFLIYFWSISIIDSI